MNDRLDIASRIAAGLFMGVPYGIDDFEQTGEVKEAEEKTIAAIARLSLMMADALIQGDKCTVPSEADFLKSQE